MHKTIKLLEGLVENCAYRNRWRFTLGDAEVVPGQMAAADCCLPVIIWRADELHRLAFGREIGVGWEPAGKAFLGVVPQPQGNLAPRSVLALFCREAMAQIFREAHPHHDPDGPPVAAPIDRFVHAFIHSVATDPRRAILLPERVLQLASGSSGGVSTWPSPQ